MSRTDSENYGLERQFLIDMKAGIDREMAHRAKELGSVAPELSGETVKVLEDFTKPLTDSVPLTLVAQFQALRLEEAILAELERDIEQAPLVHTIESKLHRIENEELGLTGERPEGRYLTNSAYWRDEDARLAFNSIFKNWARWCRGEPIKVP